MPRGRENGGCCRRSRRLSFPNGSESTEHVLCIQLHFVSHLASHCSGAHVALNASVLFGVNKKGTTTSSKAPYWKFAGAINSITSGSRSFEHTASTSMAAASASALSVPVPIFVSRGSDGIKFFQNAPPFGPAERFPKIDSPGSKMMVFSKDGSHFAHCDSQTVTVLRDGVQITSIPRSRTFDMFFSPKNTYLATWENYTLRKEGENSDNLHIWNVATGALVLSFVVKRQDGWRPQWSDDETVCARAVSTEVQIYGSDLSAGVTSRIRLPAVQSCAIAPGPAPFSIAVTVPPVKGAPASAIVYILPRVEHPVCAKSFYKADKIEVMWNSQGSAVLVSTQTEVDRTGQSYYGETNLYYLGVDGSSACVQFDHPGPIHDFDWSPNGKEFAVVYGFMPAQTAIFNCKCDVLHRLGAGPHCLVKYSPSGHLICVAGFGNLSGQMQVWDRRTVKLLSTFNAPDSTMFLWCPDNRAIITATTAPRLKVDNGYKLWHYRAGLVHTQAVKELWEVAWLPALLGTYPDRPLSPAPSKPALGAAPTVKSVYRPPGARGAPSSFKLHDDPPAAAAAAAAPSKSALKNMKKRAARKAQQGGAEGSGDEADEAAAAPEAKAPAATAAAAAAAPAAAPAQAPAAASAPAAAESDGDLDRRIRNLNKKIRQINELQEKQASGATLQGNQLEKIQGLPEVMAELRLAEQQLAKAKSK